MRHLVAGSWLALCCLCASLVGSGQRHLTRCHLVLRKGISLGNATERDSLFGKPSVELLARGIPSSEHQGQCRVSSRIKTVMSQRPVQAKENKPSHEPNMLRPVRELRRRRIKIERSSQAGFIIFRTFHPAFNAISEGTGISSAKFTLWCHSARITGELKKTPRIRVVSRKKL